jgi:hypothetical protein
MFQAITSAIITTRTHAAICLSCVSSTNEWRTNYADISDAKIMQKYESSETCFFESYAKMSKNLNAAVAREPQRGDPDRYPLLLCDQSWQTKYKTMQTYANTTFLCDPTFWLLLSSVTRKLPKVQNIYAQKFQPHSGQKWQGTYTKIHALRDKVPSVLRHCKHIRSLKHKFLRKQMCIVFLWALNMKNACIKWYRNGQCITHTLMRLSYRHN